MKISVLKFGGSSVANADRIKAVKKIIEKKSGSGVSLAVVFSAFGGVTDMLIEMSNMAAKGDKKYLAILKAFRKRHIDVVEHLLTGVSLQKAKSDLKENHKTLKQVLKGVFLVRESSPRTLDYILSFGERNSCYIISAFFSHSGLSAEYVDARRIIKTNKDFGAAKVQFEKTFQLINQNLKFKNSIPVITGFIASDLGGLTTTLGRGGSDYSAALIASALNATELEIWTDVDGVLTSNPNKVRSAYTINNLSYSEAMEMSHFGAKVIYPPTIQPALNRNIPIYIKNTFNPSFKGTLISKEIIEDGAARIKGISSINGVTLVTIEGSGMLGVPGTAARLFGSLAKADINIIMITQGSSEHSICFAVQRKTESKAIQVIREEFKNELRDSFLDPITVQSDVSLVAIVGEKMKSMPGVAGRLFQSLGRNGVNVIAIAQGSSELNITFAIQSKDEIKALNLIHDSFFLSGSKSVNVFIAGLGLIGSTLLQQIQDQFQDPLQSRHLKINIIGIANTRKMYFHRGGIDITKWEEDLQSSGVKSSTKGFIERMKAMNLPNSVFVDNTASKEIPEHYLDIISSNISICTPNKIAASSDYSNYEKIKKAAFGRNVQFCYETNVGAGLPIISTLNDLILSGDKITKIEAVLSGSLSYIFNHFNSTKSFRSVVEDAMKKGLTEPDPREDLSGMDVKRKIVILARDAQFSINLEDVEFENILPPECLKATTVPAFLKSLEKENNYFEKLIQNAESSGKVLRFIASLDEGKAKIALQSIGESSPFYNLHESDNMVAFYSERYNQRPLIVKGPGAGAQVTAAGIFAEIIRIGSQNYFGYN